jgi:hypothetical protein
MIFIAKNNLDRFNILLFIFIKNIMNDLIIRNLFYI